jgi:hypothetical protein
MQQRGIALAIGLIVTASLIAGCGGGQAAQQKPGGMPPDVAAEMQKRLGTTTGPGAGGGQTSMPNPPTGR